MIAVNPTPEQLKAWTEAAGETPLEEWLATAGDAAVPSESKYLEPVTIVLRNPIKHGARTIEQLTIRPIKAKYLRGINLKDGVTMGEMLTLASKLSGEPSQVIDELEGDDYGQVRRATEGFLLATL